MERHGRLSERVAVVTGSSSGLGRAIAIRLAADGAAVVISDLRSDPRAGLVDGGWMAF